MTYGDCLAILNTALQLSYVKLDPKSVLLTREYRDRMPGSYLRYAVHQAYYSDLLH